MFDNEFEAIAICSRAVGASVFLTFAYVASLYIWRSKMNRDHPSTIKRRFFSASCMMLFAPLLTYYCLSDFALVEAGLNVYFGLRLPGILEALTLPLLLTAILFLGPLTMLFLSGTWKLYTEPIYWTSSCQDLVWVRNHIMAPLSEEWVFRACMLPILTECHWFSASRVILAGPALFGLAHFHHMFEQVKAGVQFKTAFAISAFQFTYTSLFGAYSAYLFIRTGHFVAPLVAHMFCNHMGFPNFPEILEYRLLHRVLIILNFIIGFAAWCYLLPILTNPVIYSNNLYR